MIARQKMHAGRELALQAAPQIDGLVRFVAAVGIAEPAVNQFLHDEVAARIAGQFRNLQGALEISDIAMQIADDEDIGGVVEKENAAAAARRGARVLNCFADGRQQFRRVRHVAPRWVRFGWACRFREVSRKFALGLTNEVYHRGKNGGALPAAALQGELVLWLE